MSPTSIFFPQIFSQVLIFYPTSTVSHKYFFPQVFSQVFIFYPTSTVSHKYFFPQVFSQVLLLYPTKYCLPQVLFLSWVCLEHVFGCRVPVLQVPCCRGLWDLQTKLDIRIAASSFLNDIRITASSFLNDLSFRNELAITRFWEII